jgi:hypothetical protein
MKKVAFILLFFALHTISVGQELVYGPMISFDRTTFVIPDTSVIIIGGPGGGGPGSQDLGRESNFSAGGFLYWYPVKRAFYGGELFYSRHTASTAEGVVVSSINVIPQFGWDLLNINLFVNGGIGAGYLFSIDGFDENFDTSSVDIALKFGLTYRLKNIITIEAGIRGSVTDFEKSQEINRESLYAGVKIPLSQFISK